MRLIRWVIATPARRIVAGLLVAVLIPIAAFAWWLASPLFFDKVVDEPFPFSAGAALPANVTQEEAEKIMAEEASHDVVADEPMPPTTNAEASPPPIAPDDEPTAEVSGQNPPAAVEPSATPDPTPTIDASAEESSPVSEPDPTPAPADTPVPPEPVETVPSSSPQAPVSTPTPTATPVPTAVAIQAGNLRDADSFHRGSGRATIYELPDGSLVLRLEDLNVTNGPDLHVLLSGHADPKSRNEVKDLGYVDLGKLKGNIGNQNYEIPAGLDVSMYSSVVIYCQPFHVIFSVAPLASANA